MLSILSLKSVAAPKINGLKNDESLSSNAPEILIPEVVL